MLTETVDFCSLVGVKVYRSGDVRKRKKQIRKGKAVCCLELY